jgi:hypothetical protein
MLIVTNLLCSASLNFSDKKRSIREVKWFFQNCAAKEGHEHFSSRLTPPAGTNNSWS